jgi:hypothetical protein
MNGHMHPIMEPYELFIRHLPKGGKSWSEKLTSNSSAGSPAAGLLPVEPVQPSDVVLVVLTGIPYGAELNSSAPNIGALSYVTNTSPVSTAPFETLCFVQSDADVCWSYGAKTGAASSALFEILDAWQDRTFALYKFTPEDLQPDLARYNATPPTSELADLIIAERSHAEVDAEGVAVADAATKDALTIVRRVNFARKPRVMFSDDGILTLQWQRGEYGVALIFAGDQMVSIAFRRPGLLYAENGIEVTISDDLPAEFFDALEASS